MMRGKEEKKGRGKEEKKRIVGNIGDQITKKEKKSPCASFSSAQSSFLDHSEVHYLE